jgi:hypothetical protein
MQPAQTENTAANVANDEISQWNCESRSQRGASCLTCQYFCEQEKGYGNCHRYPPYFVGDTSAIESHRWKFPVVNRRVWCGEYKASVETPVALGRLAP